MCKSYINSKSVNLFQSLGNHVERDVTNDRKLIPSAGVLEAMSQNKIHYDETDDSILIPPEDELKTMSPKEIHNFYHR